MKAQKEIANQVRDLLAYFPGRGRLPLAWLVILPLITQLYVFWRTHHFPATMGGIPFPVVVAAGSGILPIYFPTVLVLLLRINHSDRSSWLESANIIASSVVYGIIIGLPSLLLSVMWPVCYAGISPASVVQILLGVLGVMGGVLLLAVVLGSVAHYTGYFIPLILFFTNSYTYLVPVSYSVTALPEKWRILLAAVPLSPATVVLRNGILNLPSNTVILYWVAGSIHALAGFALAFWIWRSISNPPPLHPAR